MTLATALSYVANGFHVFPIWGILNGECACGRRECPRAGKHPLGALVPNGFRNATTDPLDIRSWWQQYPQANVGIRTGEQSGIWVLDVDGEEGEQALAELENEHGSLPTTVQQTTGRGIHFFFRHPGSRVSNRSIRTNLDVRGDGGYIIVEPSVHLSGSHYAWVVGAELTRANLANAPEWLVTMVTRPTPSDPPTTRLGIEPIGGAHHALRNAAETVRNTRMGGRNNALNRTTFGLGGLVATGNLSPEEVRSTMALAANQAGLSEAETQATIESGLRAGVTAPLLERGSQVEVAQLLRSDLEQRCGEIVNADGQCWHYVGDRWVAIDDDDLRRFVYQYDGLPIHPRGVLKLTRPQIDGILHEFRCMVSRTGFFDLTLPGINCRNGFIRFDDNGEPRLLPHHPDHRRRHTLPGEWQEGTSGELDGSLLERLLQGSFEGDDDAEQKINLLEEIAGCAALGYAPHLPAPKAIIFEGPTANNGKGQILEITRGVLPEEAKVAISPSQFGDGPYLVQLAGKLLNAVDELGTDRAIASAQFKTIVTCERVTGRDVYKPAVQFRPQAQHVFATNKLPTFKDGMDRGVMRRLMVLPFNRTIPERERIPNMGRRIANEEPDLLLAMAVRGASRLIRQRGFTEPPSSRRALRDWILNSEPVIAWLLSGAVETKCGTDVRTRTLDAYKAFKSWAELEEFDRKSIKSHQNFTSCVKEVSNRFGIQHKRLGTVGPVFEGMRLRPGPRNN